MTEIWIPGRGRPLKSELAAAREQYDGKALVETGLLETGKPFVFICPTCGKTERNDQRLSPACTGPGWMDSHPMEPMILIED